MRAAGGGRRGRPTATASAPGPRDRASTPARGTLASRSPASTLGPGRSSNYMIIFKF